MAGEVEGVMAETIMLRRREAEILLSTGFVNVVRRTDKVPPHVRTDGSILFVREPWADVGDIAGRELARNGTTVVFHPSNGVNAAVFKADWKGRGPSWLPAARMPTWASRATVRVFKRSDVEGGWTLLDVELVEAARKEVEYV